MTLTASRFASHSIAPQAARASPGTASAPSLVLPTSSALCPRAGILESRWNNQRPRQPVLPFCRGSTNLVLICGVRPFFAGHHRTTGAGPSELILASAPGVCPWATPFCPFLAKTGGSRWDFVAIYFSSSSSIQTVYMGLSTGVYFTSTTAGRNDWQSFSPGGTEFCLHPHQSATA